MFSTFVYLFSAVITFLASRFFFAAWKKNQYDPYREFGAFFLFLGLGFVIPALLLFGNPALSSVAGELISFFILFSFAFVLRAFVRFQQMSAISPDTIMVLAMLASLAKLGMGMYYSCAPQIKEGLIYWHYPPPNIAIYLALLTFYTAAMGVTLLSNLRNIQKNRKLILYLGTAFLLSGAAGILIIGFNSFWPMLWGSVLLLITFVLVALFVLSSLLKKEEQP
ncbi:hypothetical protein HY250_01365 [Candidatus Azambacteria bacterium]|nr:hypothetical protein [Candidatus Azambacteria bacterium]